MLRKCGCKPDDLVFIECDEVEDDFDIDEEKGLCPREDFCMVIRRFKNRRVAVEFECGGCCKKASGILKCVDQEYVLLIAPAGKRVLVEIFCQGLKEPVVECASQAVIRCEKIVSVELAAEEVSC